jgi:hypothetical protein
MAKYTIAAHIAMAISIHTTRASSIALIELIVSKIIAIADVSKLKNLCH